MSETRWNYNVDEAPRFDIPIVGLYDDGTEDFIMYSETRCCILGSRAGSFGEGWATDGSITDCGLPVDDPVAWRRRDQADIDLIKSYS